MNRPQNARPHKPLREESVPLDDSPTSPGSTAAFGPFTRKRLAMVAAFQSWLQVDRPTEEQIALEVDGTAGVLRQLAELYLEEGGRG
jgi:hypothetical protein